MAAADAKLPLALHALKVHQWLSEWNSVKFGKIAHRRRPEDHFYLFALSAHRLRALSGISRRKRSEGLRPSQDLGIQRRHDPTRSEEIKNFIRYGYPWSVLADRKRKSGEYDDLRKPGWLPTAIVVNILTAEDTRRNLKVSPDDLIRITSLHDDPNGAIITLPPRFKSASWRPSALPPIEVIDGQHRLWAFEDTQSDSVAEFGEFEFPVVAFSGLDISWQAYLFWSINIKPTRINQSLAFDLYPLLRTENWLERFDGHSIYRETRAQELVEVLWSHQQSPWYHQINMLGEPGMRGMTTQAAWIRSLLATYVKSWEGTQNRLGGLFGAKTQATKEALPWSRGQQAAFLILVGQKLNEAVSKTRLPWTVALRNEDVSKLLKDDEGPRDLAFSGPHSLLSTDQGIRGVLAVTNDVCYVRAGELTLADWSVSDTDSSTDEKVVENALKSLKKQTAATFLDRLAVGLARYDWRTSSGPGLTEQMRLEKAAFRGSGGYRELRKQLLRHLSHASGDVGDSASRVRSILGYA